MSVALAVLGVALVLTGGFLASVPLGLIVAGVVCLAGVYLLGDV